MNDSKYPLDPELLCVIRCPKEGTSLAIASDSLLHEINRKIAAGQVRDAMDQRVDEPLEAGLVTVSGHRLYPVRGGIASLVADEAIELHDLCEPIRKGV